MSEKLPLVSVVMSVYNGERHVREAIESILNQTFRDFEFIIVNDGSADRTRKILESCKDGRVVLIHQENQGLTKALNKGISLARGKYIARQDADDVSKPERLAKQAAFMEENQAAGLVSSWFEFIDERGNKTRIGQTPTDNAVIKERLIKINQFCHGAAMIRKEAVDTVGAYREFFKYAQDHDLWLRIAEKYEVWNLPEPLYSYRVLDKAISSEKLLPQSRYAGAAIKQALLRRETGADDLERGLKPVLPPVSELSFQLKKKLYDFYIDDRMDMLRKGKFLRYLKGTCYYIRLRHLIREVE
jgi:glycosyltransferase involved in cell wall biosynthesis